MAIETVCLYWEAGVAGRNRLVGTQTFTTTGTFTAPTGVTEVTVSARAGGGGGGSAAVFDDGQGGGGGGAFAKGTVPVTPGNNYTVTVAAQVAAQTAGQNSTFIGDGGAKVEADGGTAASNYSGQPGGTVALSTGNIVKYAGGGGGNGGQNYTYGGGGGGEGAGSTATGGAGGNYSGASGGAGGSGTDGGNGGNGGTYSGSGNNGSPGVAPGGGGGGSSGSGSGTKTGGTGARGEVLVEWLEIISLTISESITETESVQLDVPTDFVVTNAVGTTELVDIGLTCEILVSDNLTLAEATDTQLISLISISDTVGLAGAPSLEILAQVTVQATVTASEAINIIPVSIGEYYVIAGEPIGVSEATLLDIEVSIVQADTVIVGEVANNTLVSLVEVTEVIALAESSIFVVEIGVQAQETIALTDTSLLTTSILAFVSSDGISVIGLILLSVITQDAHRRILLIDRFNRVVTVARQGRVTPINQSFRVVPVED